jgi:hypothetical protein
VIPDEQQIDTHGLAKLLEALNERCECEGGMRCPSAMPCPPEPPRRWWLATADGEFVRRDARAGAA